MQRAIDTQRVLENVNSMVRYWYLTLSSFYIALGLLKSILFNFNQILANFYSKFNFFSKVTFNERTH